MTSFANLEATAEIVGAVRRIINVAVTGSLGRHDYLPPEGAGTAEVRAFEPHDWVVNAVALAFVTGATKATCDPAYRTTPAEATAVATAIFMGVNISDTLK